MDLPPSFLNTHKNEKPKWISAFEEKIKLFTTERNSNGPNLLEEQKTKLVLRSFLQQNTSVDVMSWKVHSSVWVPILGALCNPRRLLQILPVHHLPMPPTFLGCIQSGWLQTCTFSTLSSCLLYFLYSWQAPGWGREELWAWGESPRTEKGPQGRTDKLLSWSHWFLEIPVKDGAGWSGLNFRVENKTKGKKKAR